MFNTPEPAVLFKVIFFTATVEKNRHFLFVFRSFVARNCQGKEGQEAIVFLKTSQMELQLEKQWKIVKEKLKEHNTALTDADLYYEKGREDELIERLAKKMNRSKQEIKAWIESLSFND